MHNGGQRVGWRFSERAEETLAAWDRGLEAICDTESQAVAEAASGLHRSSRFEGALLLRQKRRMRGV